MLAIIEKLEFWTLAERRYLRGRGRLTGNR